MSERLLYAAVLLSVFGLVLLVLVSSLIELPYVKVGDVDSSLLERNVHLRGDVAGVHAFKGGSLLITLAEDNSTIDVYLPYSVAIGLNETELDGAKADLVGVVQLYNGKLEVVVGKAGDLVLK